MILWSNQSMEKAPFPLRENESDILHRRAHRDGRARAHRTSIPMVEPVL